MLTTRKQFSFPQFRILWVKPDRIERMERSRGKPFSYNTQNILISIGYPWSYSHTDHGVFGGFTVNYEVMIDDTDISRGIIFRRNLKNAVLFAKTITQPFVAPNIDYEWRLEKPIKYPDVIEQHQFITKRIIFGCRIDYYYYIFEANPIKSEETFRQTLEAKFPAVILATDLSPHIRNEVAVDFSDTSS
ncbi:hypothetical protein LOD99_7820 [Oopsacas minuta]|uniref:Uncharacterized protein n=1 Tax=Oopsacas minuta TaxID=111878 RepID=A0AAV7JQM4_9METZ|nr:hypothetical protein LOD99_7820 [Oopsacas minuta]